MSSLFPASRPVLGALALASALLLSACAGEEPDATGAADAATGSGAAPSAATPVGTGPDTGTGDATEPAGAGAGEQSGDRSTAEPAESRAADAPSEGPAAAEGGSAGDATDAGGTNDAAADENGTAAGGGTAGARTGDGAPLCTTSQLVAAAAPVGGAAGSVHVDLVLTNAGGSPCTLAGYAGVSFVDAAGTMIGSPAVRDAAVPGTGRVVAPGESVSAGLRVGQAGNHPTCDARPASGLRVYPPENTELIVIPFPVEACGDPRIHQLEIQGLGA